MHGSDHGSRSIVKNNIKELKSIITAYQFLSEEKERNKYINMIRLRSLASQHLNMRAALKDGYIYPFMIFSVVESDNVSNHRFTEIMLTMSVESHVGVELR
jgi:hypothetical protein